MPSSILSDLRQYLADKLDVNESPMPRGVAVLRSLLGEAPDELGVSVMNPKAKEIRAAAEPAYAVGTALGIVPALSMLKKVALATRPVAVVEAPVREHKMYQGVFRGYAGDNPDLGILGERATRYFASPQQRAAKVYADRYAQMYGVEPHMEMIMIDPFKGTRYPHIPTVTRNDPTTFTMAREILPEEIISRHQLYAKGGLAQLKECSCGY